MADVDGFSPPSQSLESEPRDFRDDRQGRAARGVPQQASTVPPPFRDYPPYSRQVP